MAAGNFGSPTQLIILLAIVLLLFGGKRLRNLGGDLGNAIKGFKEATNQASTTNQESTPEKPIEKIAREPSPLESVVLREKNHNH